MQFDGCTTVGVLQYVHRCLNRQSAVRVRSWRPSPHR
jgi:hypothetical protein